MTKSKISRRKPSPNRISFNTYASASSYLGGQYTPDILRAAKRAGCPAFRSNRIYPNEIPSWLRRNPIDPGQLNAKRVLEARKLEQECIRLERQNTAAERQLVAVEVVEEINARFAAELDKAVRAAFGDDLLHKLEGANFAARKAIIIEACDGILAAVYAPLLHSDSNI